MNFITINSKKFMKLDIPNNTYCHGNDEAFITKLTKFILYHYDIYCKETKIFTKKKAPFFVGFNGSVASGKSHIAEHVNKYLTKCKVKTAILSTDNFIFPNKKLIKNKIMDKKGFPESYDISKLLRTLKILKAGKSASIPLYDQAISDISHKKLRISANTDIVIIEGINLLQSDAFINCSCIRISDYLDYSIYIDASESHLKHWFLTRLIKKKTKWKKRGIKKKLTRKTKKQFSHWANSIWNNINKINLKDNILPFKERADLIIFKKKNHTVKELAIRI